MIDKAITNVSNKISFNEYDVFEILLEIVLKCVLYE